jgi:glutathione synthase/RimK-type ligase-like ATP-grasp enzyme
MLKSLIKKLRGEVRKWRWTPGYEKRSAEKRTPGLFEKRSYRAPAGGPVVGITLDHAGYHKHFIAACEEMQVSYEVLDLYADDWIEQVGRIPADLYLVWPPVRMTIWKQMADERLRLLTEVMGKRTFPSTQEIWLYESKRRCRDWMILHDVPHPRSWVFFDYDQAKEFASRWDGPIVYKTDHGASSSGVQILRTRAELLALIEKVFRKGVIAGERNPVDRQWGVVFLQEFLPKMEEWRMERIGDSYMGYQKLEGEDGMRSGSGKSQKGRPPEALLQMTREITEKGGFRSIAIDMFLTPDGRVLVNELQTVFGTGYSGSQLEIDGVEGRLLYQDGAFIFEPGEFSRNHCCNLRVQYVLDTIVTRSATG